MFCPNCGASIPDGIKFCGQCGAKLDNFMPPAQPGNVAGAPGAAANIAGGTSIPAGAPRTAGNAPAAPAGNANFTPVGNAPAGNADFAPIGNAPGNANFAGASPVNRPNTMNAATFGNKPAGTTKACKPAISPLTIATVVLAAIALIFSVMPWFHTNSTLVQYSGYADTALQTLGSLTGQSTGKWSIEEEYSLPQFIELAGTAQKYESTANDLANALSSGSSKPSASAQSTSVTATFSIILYLTFALWLACIVLTIVGAVLMFTGKKSNKLLCAGLAAFAVLGLLYTVLLYGALSPVATGFPTNALICSFAAAAGVVCAILSKSNAIAAPTPAPTTPVAR